MAREQVRFWKKKIRRATAVGYRLDAPSRLTAASDPIRDETVVARDRIAADRRLPFREASQLANWCAGACLACGMGLRVQQDHVVAVQQTRSPSSSILIPFLRPKLSHVPRSEACRPPIAEAAFSAAPMPPPISRYQPFPTRPDRACRFPQPLLQRIGAALIASRDERRLGGGDRLQGRDRVVRARDMRRDRSRADDDEVVPGDLGAGQPCPAAMNSDSASGSCTSTRSASPCAAVASACPVLGRPPAPRSRFSRELRQDVRRKPAILDRGGRGQHDRSDARPAHPARPG